MRNNRPPRIALLLILLATAFALVIAVPVTAESAAELLEKAMYAEQTVGDLVTAIRIYEQIVEDAEANRMSVAQAQYRLGVCQLKIGNNAAAKKAFDSIIRDYPEQTTLVSQARGRLIDTRPALALDPAPWEDREFLEYRISLQNGKAIGAAFQTASSAVVDGADAWQLETRVLILSTGDNYGVSRILVERDTLEPFSSTFRHGALGTADTTYGADGIDIVLGDTNVHLTSEQTVYDNEQYMHLLRMLPLAPGFKTSINLLPTISAVVAEVGIEVTGTDVCAVPAGRFDCLVVSLDLGVTTQTVWLSTGPERYLLKVSNGGILFELAETGRQDPDASVELSMPDFGFSGTLPATWRFYEHRAATSPNRAAVRFLGPDTATISSLEIDRCPAGNCPLLLTVAERELSGAEERFKDFELRPESWTERTIDGRPAISFVGDYQRNGDSWVQYRIYTFVDEVRLEFIFRVTADRFDEVRADLDAIAESIEAR